jgi:hypothetical protein
MTSNFQKIKGSISVIIVDLKKPKELVKKPSPQSLGSFSNSSIKEVKLFENFQKPKIGIFLEFF